MVLKRVTCPVCGRLDRALTSTGRIMQHHDLGGTARLKNSEQSRHSQALCPASGQLFGEEVVVRVGFPDDES